MLEDNTSQLIERKDENLTSILIEQKQEIPEPPNYMKERTISKYTVTVFATVIVFCAIISLIVNIKRKSTIRIVLSSILPIVVIIISKFLEQIVLNNVLKNGTESSSIIFIIATLIIMSVIFLSLVIMIFKKTKKQKEI